MGLIDFILNVAGILLWLNWRASRFDPLVTRTPATLVGTLKPATPSKFRGWHFLVGLLGLLGIRALLYGIIGPAVDWNPSLPLGAISVAFRSDHLVRILLYSLLSFLVAIGVFYLWLLLFSIVNGRSADEEPLQKLIKLHLGWIDRWPWAVKAALPALTCFAAWYLLSFGLARLGMIPPVRSPAHRIEQSLILVFQAYLTWKYPIVVVLGASLLGSYIYFGSSPLWSFIHATGRRLMLPLRGIPLQIGRVDFAPVLALALVFLATELGSRGLAHFLEVRPPF
jgi:uncharacterized protein YggT (Ycf19 family)